jgi:hypothetical protein
MGQGRRIRYRPRIRLRVSLAYACALDFSHSIRRHVVGAYWAFYRVARNYPGLTKTPWQWYLKQAVLTIQALTNGRTGYTDVGLMDETTLLQVLLDLKREGAAWTAQAADVETRMKARAQPWSTQRYPFGSEMAWDSTGQEGVWAWSNYFGYTGTAANVVNSIIAYQPTVPHWGYNGNARRYWDNVGPSPPSR